MKDANIKLPFGLNADDLLVHVDDVEGGKRCNCSCPACRSPLIAAKGQHNQHHFRHAAGKECAAGLESAIHLAAKRVIREDKRVVLPEFVVTVAQTDFAGHTHREEKVVVPQNTAMEMDSVEEEATLEGIRVDILGRFREKPLIIEILYRHEVDGEKLEKIRQQRISAVEIDLSDLSQDDVKDWEAFRAYVHDPDRVKWLHNEKAERVRHEIQNGLSQKVKSINNNHKEPMRKSVMEEKGKRKEEMESLNRARCALKVVSSPERIAHLAKTAEQHPAWRYCRNYLPFTWGTLPDWLNASVPCGDWIFGCDRRVWQAAFYNSFVRGGKGEPFSVKYVDEWLQDKRGCKEPSCVKTVRILGMKHGDIQEIPSTWTSIREYCELLCEYGMLEYSDGAGLYGKARRDRNWFKRIRTEPAENIRKPAVSMPPDS